MIACGVHAMVAKEHEEGIVAELAKDVLDQALHLLELWRHTGMCGTEAMADVINTK